MDVPTRAGSTARGLVLSPDVPGISMRDAEPMDPTPSDPLGDPGRAPAQAFQPEGQEHIPSATPRRGIPTESGPSTAHQHEDDEPLVPID